MNSKILAVVMAVLVTTGTGVGVYYGAQSSASPQVTVAPTEPPAVDSDSVSNITSESILNVTFSGIKRSTDQDIEAPPEGLIRYVFKLNITKGAITYNVQGFDQALAPLVTQYGLAPADYDNSTLMRLGTQEKFEVCSYNLTPLSNDQIENLTIDIQTILSEYLK